MPEPISNLIVNLLNSEWFYALGGIWLLISIGHKSERTTLLDRLKDLISKPVITDSDDNATSVPFYPRKTFERVARAVSKALVQIPAEINTFLKNAINIPAAEINSKWSSLDKNKPVLLYHFGGQDPYSAAKILVNQGFTKVYVLTPGLFGLRWQAANLSGKSSLKDWVVNVPEENK